MARSDTPAFDIKVDTNSGVVPLSWTGPSDRGKLSAATEVHKVGGIETVENGLLIALPNDAKQVARADANVKSAIEKRLGARGALDDASIGVDVRNGVARRTTAQASDRYRGPSCVLLRRWRLQDDLGLLVTE